MQQMDPMQQMQPNNSYCDGRPIICAKKAGIVFVVSIEY